MKRITLSITFEGPTDPEELLSCIEEALVQFRYKGLPFATTAEDEPISIVDWREA